MGVSSALNSENFLKFFLKTIYFFFFLLSDFLLHRTSSVVDMAHQMDCGHSTSEVRIIISQFEDLILKKNSQITEKN